MLQVNFKERGKGDVANGVRVHAVKNRGGEESCKRFFRFFEFLFAEVGHHFLAGREAEIVRVGHAGHVVVTVFNRLAVDRHDALHASELGVEVEVTFFQFVFHDLKNGDFLVSCKRFFVFFLRFLFDHFRHDFRRDGARDRKMLDAEIFGGVAFEVPSFVPVSAFALRDDFSRLDGAGGNAVIGNVGHFNSRDQIGDVLGGGGDFGGGCFHVSENESFSAARKFFFDYFFGQFSCQVIFFVQLARDFFFIFLLDKI